MAEQEAPASETTLPRRFLFNINFVFASALTSNTLGFFVVILLARALGPDGRGVTVLYQAAVSLGFAFLSLGISSAAFYFVARREITGRQAMEAGFNVSLVAGGVAAIAVAITALFFEQHLEGKDIPYGLAIFTIPAVIQLRVTELLLRAEGRFGALNALDVGLPISMFACLGGVELAVGLTVPRAVWAWSLAYLPLVVAGYWLLGPAFWPRRLATVSLMLKMLTFGGQGQLTTLIQLFNYRLDSFLILVLVNTSGVGIYSVASSQTEGLLIIANSVAIVLLTNITSGDRSQTAGLTAVTCRNTLLVTGVAAAGAAVIAAFWIPVVFGGDFSGAVVPYLFLLPGMVMLSGSKILAAYVFSRGRPIINAWIALATLLATIPTDIVLIHLFGVTGAAIGASLGYTLGLVLTAIAYGRLSGASITAALVPQLSDAAIYLDGLRSLRAKLGRRRPAKLPSGTGAS
jgi:O-antigen/teichoic acid export membrane protein